MNSNKITKKKSSQSVSNNLSLGFAHTHNSAFADEEKFNAKSFKMRK